MFHRVVRVPFATSRRYFAAQPAFKVGDKVQWVDPMVVKHKQVVQEQKHENLYGYVAPKWKSEFFKGTVLEEFNKETKTIKIDFGTEAYHINGVQNVTLDRIGFLQKLVGSLLDVKMKTLDGQDLDIAPMQGRVGVCMNVEDNSVETDYSWRRLGRIIQTFNKNPVEDQPYFLIFPNFKFDKNVEFVEQKLGFKLAENNVVLMQKNDVNGSSTQPAYRFLKQFYPDRIDHRWAQRAKSTLTWCSPKFIIDRNGGVSTKVLGGPLNDLKVTVEHELLKILEEGGVDKHTHGRPTGDSKLHRHGVDYNSKFW